jgi:hypothetical protein
MRANVGKIVMRAKTVVAFVVLAGWSVPVSAQVDLSGTWAPRSHEDVMERLAGPYSVDYTGLPFNEGGRARALSYSQSQLSMPERVCLFYPPTYLVMGPFGMKIWNETDSLTGNTISWKIGGWEDRAPTTIWMDGRPHPSKNAPHEKSGFTTGAWDGDVLTAYMTHMKAGYIRRNGAPSSDETTMALHFLRHDDLLTVTALIEDPIYLSEPIYVTRTFQLDDANPLPSMGPPCIQGDEGPQEGAVPHYLPGKNPFVDEVTKLYNIPVEAILGGAETMYPEFRKKLKDKYVRPEKCVRNCGGPNGPGTLGGLAGN